ncbi:hypothetical protein [Phytoactinopolyspora endophytica]|uniref:hypothetical protein n=1 Tax=Phytoactinopolyspora endophytica TaxID=1642495 RepID=UPI00101DDC46|nr:hypothetical protein [Phytoactinopolyspora endophytica]
MKAGAVVVGAALAVVLAGCGSDDDGLATVPDESAATEDHSPESATPEATPTPEVTVPDDDASPPGEEQTPQRPLPESLTPAPSPDESPPATGEVPDEYMDPVIADAVERASATAEDVVVVRAQAVTWSDGSLGCPEPGMMYTQALVDGYWVELEVDDEHFDYRLGKGGSFRLCTSPSLKPPTTERPAF